MSSTAGGAAAGPVGLLGRLWSLVVAAWGVVTGITPHILHHVGPLAGTALVAGAGGQIVFAGVGLAATIPMLLKLRRRFGTWVAPAIALAVFAAVFSLSTLVIGPRISRAGETAQAPEPTLHDAHGHAPTAAASPGG